ncbi:MAG: DUF423 domain-containing protein [Magnetococcus sp. DMHC-1]|nr:DUF423 domain-containing protein [Magnetococcales bacterium]
MNTSAKFIFLGATNAALAVMLGAFGKHALAPIISEKLLETWRTGAYYHLVHAVGLVLIGVLQERSVRPDRSAIAGWLLLAGILIFSGSLYALVLTGLRPLGILTPFGGLCFISGWLWLAWSMFVPHPHP